MRAGKSLNVLLLSTEESAVSDVAELYFTDVAELSFNRCRKAECVRCSRAAVFIADLHLSWSLHKQHTNLLSDGALLTFTNVAQRLSGVAERSAIEVAHNRAVFYRYSSSCIIKLHLRCSRTELVRYSRGEFVRDRVARLYRFRRVDIYRISAEIV